MKKLLPVFFALLIISSCKDKEKEVAVESVTIDKGATAEIRLGETLTLKATVLPENATSREVSWNSSKPEIATVSGAGIECLVTSLKEGETIISATAGGITAKCTVTVIKFIPLTKISFTTDKMTLVINNKKTLTPLFTPANASDRAVVWNSDKEDIATVSQSGEIEAKKTGICKITVKSSKSPSIAATCEVEVVAAPIPLTGLTAIPADTTVEANSSFTLKYRTIPANATNVEVAFESSDVTKAAVKETGEVKALDITTTGSPVIITIKSKDAPSISATCKLTIVAATVRVNSIVITPDAFTLSVGQKKTLGATVMPSNATNQTVTWKSSDESKATVSNTGEVTARTTLGEVYITATAKDGSNKVGTATVTIIPVAASIDIHPANPVVAVVGFEKTITLTVSVTPATASKTVTWESSNTTAATIDATTGVVTGKTIGGETVITAKTTDGSNLSATKTVTVKSSDVSLTAMKLGANNNNYAVTFAEDGKAYLNNAPRAFSITAVPVTFTTAEGATVKIGGAAFTSGQVVNFSSLVDFIVTAADGATTKTYTVGIPAYDATNNPYGIYTAAQLSDVRNAIDKSFKLMNDIALPALTDEQASGDLAISDYAEKGWKPLGIEGVGLGEFRGTFDGNNHSITNLRINRSSESYIGLFSKIFSSAVVKSLGVVSVGVYGNATVGVLVGQCYINSSILNSSAAGPVNGNVNVGGLCGSLGGYNTVTREPEKGTISNCYASGTPTGSKYVGGLVGRVVYGDISNSYAIGTPVGTDTPHGLAGESTNSNSRISNCFATGGYGLTKINSSANQSPVTNSYYPAQSSVDVGDCGTAVSAGATQSTFAGFDFNSTWTWTNGKWPKLRNVPGTQPDVDLPR